MPRAHPLSQDHRAIPPKPPSAARTCSDGRLDGDATDPAVRTGRAGQTIPALQSPMPSPLHLVLFDLAGTLIRDVGLTRAIFEHVAAEDGLPAPDRAWMKTCMGRRKPDVMAQMLERAGQPATPDRIDRLSARFETAINDRLHTTPAEPLPGAMEAVRAIEAAGIRCGVTTGYPTSTAELIVRQLDWSPEILVASDQVERGRPAPDMIHLAMTRAGVTDAAHVGTVGDTPRDLESGLAAGCGLIVGVGHGTHDRAELTGYAGTIILDDLDDLPARAGAD